MLRFQIQGADALVKAMKKLPKSMTKTVMRAALKKVAEPVRAMAAARAPVGETGRYKDSFVIKSTLSKSQRKGQRYRLRGGVVLYVGSTDPKAHLLEFGTVNMRARPTLRPAWDLHKSRMLESLGRELWKALARAAKRLAKSAVRGKLSLKRQRELLGR